MIESLPEALRQTLRAWPAARAYTVAFSGGLDSTVLLHGLREVRAALPGPLSAVHVDHGLHPDSVVWERHCRGICGQWEVPYRSCRAAGRPPRGQSTEDWARDARYALLRAQMEPADMLLTAHQRDDQAETMLLQLCRGAGPAGLAAMPALRSFGDGWLGRPLLDVTRADLARYAGARRLSWLEDPANGNTTFDRNFARLELLPLLRQRWPGIDATLVRSAGLQAGTQSVLGEIAALDLAACRGPTAYRLRLPRLRAWSWPRQANVLRHWLHGLGLPPPAHGHLLALRAQLDAARTDAGTQVTWPGAEVRVFAGELWAAPTPVPRDARPSLPWCLREPCTLAHGHLAARVVRGAGLARSRLHDDAVQLGFRAGGEWLRPAGDCHRRELRKLFQLARVPPWLRTRVPLLHVDGRLAAVAGLWVAAEFRAAEAEEGWVVAWEDAGVRVGEGGSVN